jgi:hypothetical protein
VLSQATLYLCKQYASANLSAAEIERVLLSLGDHRAYQTVACRSVSRMRQLLEENFGERATGGGGGRKGSPMDLTLSYMVGGSKLSHSHVTQFTFVKQTLALWHLACERMFKLWHAADADLLGDSHYRLCNTGQGLNRVQVSHNISYKMTMRDHLFRPIGERANLIGWRLFVPEMRFFRGVQTLVQRCMAVYATCSARSVHAQFTRRSVY